MRLVITMLSTQELQDNEIIFAKRILTETFCNKIEVQKYKYGDRKYYEVDIDLLDVTFHKSTINQRIYNLIKALEKILVNFSTEVDIICANDDTETDIRKYEIDNNDIQDFGLFITKRQIVNVVPYYKSDICNAYLNFEYTSFGCVF